MKTTVILSMIFIANLSFASLKSAVIPTKVTDAVDAIYEIGRELADAGGIASIQALQSEKSVSDADILFEVMFNEEMAESSAYIAEITCDQFNGLECLHKVISGSEDVRANYQFNDIFEFIAELSSWDFFYSQQLNLWGDSLNVVADYTKEFMGEGFRTYSYGYDYIADVFVIVLISSDSKKALVFTGDYGA